MTGTAELLADCHARGIRLIPAGQDNLTVDAPEGALDPDFIGRLRAHKSELLALLTPEAPALDFTGWVPATDVAGRVGWEAPGLPDETAWWRWADFDDLPEPVWPGYLGDPRESTA